MVLKYCELSLKSGRTERVGQILGTIGDDLADWPTPSLLRLLIIGQKSGASGAAARALGLICDRDTIPRGVATHIVKLAHSGASDRLAHRVRDRLEALVPPDERDEFRFDSLSILLGPTAALARVRRTRRSDRTPVQAAAMTKALIHAGERRLALRYVRRCRRRWPRAFRFVQLQVAALNSLGNPEEALRFLDSVAPGDASLDVFRLRIESLIECGRLGEADRLLESQSHPPGAAVAPASRMRMKLGTGDIAAADALVPIVASDLGRGQRGRAAFGITHLGAMLSEAKLLARISGLSPGTAAPDDETQTWHEHYFHAAKPVLDAWEAGRDHDPAPEGNNPIPRKIMQYWNTAEIPDEVEAEMDSWRHVPGYAYRVFDRRSAIEFLRTRFDDSHVRAFRLANHVAEECDFLRLCLLLAEGGIYADADDRLTGDPEALRGLGRGLILFRESFGAVANNLMISRPGHPLLRIAVDMCRAALLRRDNDGTWSKTGPGLMTRATACYLKTTPPGDVAREFSLVPRYVGMRQVQLHVPLPYKSTPAYWNSIDGALPPELVRILELFAEGENLEEAIEPHGVISRRGSQ